MGSDQQRRKISFYKSQSSLQLQKKLAESQIQQPFSVPIEFVCPISNSLMADPVIVSSGQTLERNCIHACVSLSFTPSLAGGADFSIVIPNLALKSAILSWCHLHRIDPPKTIDFYSAQKLLRTLMNSEDGENGNRSVGSIRGSDKLGRTPSVVSAASSDVRPSTLPFATRPSCYSSCSSCDNEIIANPSFSEEAELMLKLKSSQISDQEEGFASLRKLTRTREDTRLHLCTPRLLSTIKSLIPSKYVALQVNAIAALMNLSLEKQNKVKIVRSGIVPPLINVLHGRFPESQEHAAGALFSLSLDDQNKTAIGVLGALPPPLHALRSASERIRHYSAMALYHLSLVQSNRVKMVKLGSVQTLLGMVKSDHMPARVMLVLCNLAASMEGRASMLDGGAVDCFVSLLRRDEFDSVATRDRCLAVFYGLSNGGLRFKGLAKQAGAEKVLEKLEGRGSDHVNEKVRRILETLRKKDEEENEEIDWEELLNSDEDVSRTQRQIKESN
ncbi:U-box domain-containing protein 40-like [Primulina huaijiensis]|uniref:U-box domain-containing protein 40-like n=1 Tax=Primulina huaijiensis TaxID=1492673 RepID=UPI003CC71569